jgi:hypothetical protein
MAMNMDNAPRLGPTSEAPRIKNTPRKPRQTKKPSELAKERQDKEMSNMTLAERLLMASEAMPPGEGMVGKALKAGVSGAAVGATLGEALASHYQKKIQGGQKRKPRTISETSMRE